MAFSSSALLADMDYLAPSQACIKPMLVKDTKSAAASNGLARRQIGDAAANEEIVKISLQDCLACSGCVTSAETMLVEKQSKTEILAELAANPQKPVAVSISDQSATSIGVQLGLGVADAMCVISGFVRDVLRADLVVDLRWATRVSVYETAVEFADRLANRPEALPLIVSACPGWVCYCEKQHPALLPLLCPIKSGQAIAAEFLKTALAAHSGAHGDHVATASFHISIEPCFDKKLEAVREDFADAESGARYTDFVISTAELLVWMREVEAEPARRWRAPLDSAPDPARPPCRAECEAAQMEGSGGYHQVALDFALSRLMGTSMPMDDIRYVTKRNANLRVIPFALADGVEREVCVAYGFQHIQNIVRGLNRKMPTVAKYAFVELMACPDGCLNGGGQVRTTKHHETIAAVGASFQQYVADLAARGTSPDTPLADDAPRKAPRQEGDATSHDVELKLRRARAAEGSSVNVRCTFDAVYGQWLKAAPGSPAAHAQLSTTFHDRKAQMEEILKETPIAHSLKW